MQIRFLPLIVREKSFLPTFIKLQIKNDYVRTLQQKEERYQRVKSSYIFRQPERLYDAQSLKLDQFSQKLIQEMQTLLYEKNRLAQDEIHRFKRVIPVSQVKEKQQQRDFLTQRLNQQIQLLVEKKQNQFQQSVQALDLLSPLKIMGRGYSYTTKESKVVKSIQEIAVDDQLAIHYPDGQAQVKIIALEEEEHGRADI